MRWVEAAEMRGLDERAIASGVSGALLMERAGYGVARAVRRLAETMLEGARTPLTFIAGKGNNGGDAFVAARILAGDGFPVRVIRTHRLSDPRGDAAVALARMRRAGVKSEVRDQESAWDKEDVDWLPFAGIIIDGLLGTGARGAVRGTAAAAIRWVNRAARRQRVVSIDIPSGMCADTGDAPGDVVAADLTVCMALPKAGLQSIAALKYRGRVEVVDIGIPRQAERTLPQDGEMITARDVTDWLARRDPASHKGTFGHLLVVGGSHGFCGAPGLAALSACRAGAGLVSAAVPAGIHSIVAAQAPEAMVHPLTANAAGGLGGDSLNAWRWSVDRFDSVVVGPGMMASNATRVAVEHVLERATGAVLLDADALNVFTSEVEALNDGRGPKILTPHPGEAARLLGLSVAEVQQNRRQALLEIVRLTGATVVLKGAGTLVGAPDGAVWTCLGGNPGMGSGGTGDVLAGVIGALNSQGLTPVQACAAGVWLHALAGDIAAWRIGQASMTATDVIQALPDAFARVCIR